MTLPSPKVCKLIRQLFRLIGSPNPTKRQMHAINWSSWSPSTGSLGTIFPPALPPPTPTTRSPSAMPRRNHYAARPNCWPGSQRACPRTSSSRTACRDHSRGAHGCRVVGAPHLRLRALYDHTAPRLAESCQPVAARRRFSRCWSSWFLNPTVPTTSRQLRSSTSSIAGRTLCSSTKATISDYLLMVRCDRCLTPAIGAVAV